MKKFDFSEIYLKNQEKFWRKSQKPGKMEILKNLKKNENFEKMKIWKIMLNFLEFSKIKIKNIKWIFEKLGWIFLNFPK